MIKIFESFKMPLRNNVLEKSGLMTREWQWFFRSMQSALYPLGIERQFTLVNNQSSAADIDGLVLNKNGISQAIVEYLVQRVTTGGGAVELIEAGSFSCAYRPTSDDWVLTVRDENSPANANIVFTITSAGQVQYTTSNEGGTASLSNIFWRVRTLGGKNKVYSTINK